MRLTRYEMETIINWNSAEDTASISTRMSHVMRYMEKELGLKPVTVYKDANGKTYGKDYEIPKLWVRLPRRPRKVSEELRKKMAERLAGVRARGKVPA